MKCTNCGYDLEENVACCPNCNTQIEQQEYLLSELVVAEECRNEDAVVEKKPNKFKEFLKKQKKIWIPILAVVLIISTIVVGNVIKANKAAELNAKAQSFVDVLMETQDYLDTVGDDIYTYWHDAIYEDKYLGSIDVAIYAAQLDNEKNLLIIEDNTAVIKGLYKDLRETKYSHEVKTIMTAYTDYYEFVVNVSGSFKTYSADQEKLKKELASSIKDLAIIL